MIKKVSMKREFRLKSNKHSGFTIIEVMIVLAISGLIMAIIFLALPELQASVRDSHRKAYARAVFAAMEEYYKNNERFPGCVDYAACPDGKNDAAKFIVRYMPEGSDPTTGLSYKAANESDLIEGLYTSGSRGLANPSHSIIFYFVGSSTSHNMYPGPGQMYIGMSHWCYATNGKDPTGGGPPLAGINGDNYTDKFAIVIYQEHGDYFCMDNFNLR
jgi:prepilin-type N-terminal cleavage/methylation domain-containing protein